METMVPAGLEPKLCPKCGMIKLRMHFTKRGEMCKECSNRIQRNRIMRNPMPYTTPWNSMGALTCKQWYTWKGEQEHA